MGKMTRLSKRRYYDTFFENNMGKMKKKPGKESMNFYIDGKKT